MTTKTIARLETARARLADSLDKNFSQLNTARRRNERRSADRINRKYYGLGCAVEVALNTLWPGALCEVFRMAEYRLYAAGYLERAGGDIPHPFRIIDGSTRQMRIRWGIVVCLMVHDQVIPASELESAVRTLRHAGQRRDALEGLTDIQDIDSDLSKQLMSHWDRTSSSEPSSQEDDC